MGTGSGAAETLKKKQTKKTKKSSTNMFCFFIAQSLIRGIYFIEVKGEEGHILATLFL